MTETEYFVRRGRDGSLHELVRIYRTADELWGEYFQDGEWHESGTVMDYLIDPSLGDKISEDEAGAIAGTLGGRL